MRSSLGYRFSCRKWPQQFLQGRTLVCGKIGRSDNPFLGIDSVCKSDVNQARAFFRLTSGISTATSIPYFPLDIGLTEVLLFQLPARRMLLGGSKATFQFESSDGSGIEYGTDIPFLRSGLAASNGCIGEVDGIWERNVWSVRRNCSSGSLCFSFGRTLGSSSSI